MLRRSAGAALLSLVLVAGPVVAEPHLPPEWPPAEQLRAVSGENVTFASSSPYILADAADAPATNGIGQLFLPEGASAADPVPAVVMLHGAGGVLGNRERTYARQFAAMGIAALIVDSFAARRDRAVGFIERLMEITEVMLVADAYAALAYLDELPQVDAGRTVLIGFSYGGMASVLAMYEQVAEALAPRDLRFAGHVAFYGPCIVRFSEPATTGAPLLMLWGSQDAIVDASRCGEIADDLRGGGSSVDQVIYEDAFHQWDGGFTTPRMRGRSLAACAYRVDGSGVAWDQNVFVPLLNRWTRQLSLGLCADSDGYMIGRDDAVRARSNAEMGRFLERVWAQN